MSSQMPTESKDSPYNGLYADGLNANDGATPRGRSAATGLLNSLSHPRLKDRLEALVQSGNIDPTHIRIWSNYEIRAFMRAKVLAINTTARQKWLDDVGAVTLLMYHLTFYLIGYAESYTDYTQHHWPSAPYPLSLSAGARLNGASHD